MARRDSEEFTSFVVAHQARLRRVAYLMCGDWSLASDYVQDALVLRVRAARVVDLSMSDGVLAFQGSDPATPKAISTFRADLRTAVLVDLGPVGPHIEAPLVAGRYVLWHDAQSYHVGRFAE